MNDLGMEENSRKKEPKKRSAVSYIIEFAIYIALILLCIFWVPEHVVQRTVVSGESMENTLHNGESLLVNKIAYEPSRYDIVVFYPLGREEDEYYVKRIYGLPGETVQIKGKDIYINNQIIEDKYAKNAMDDAGIAEEPLKLGEDEYFVLGDNRNNSTDGRAELVGNIHKDDIIGRAWVRIYPFEKFGKLKHQ